MATIGDFINNFIKQAGIPADDKQLIDILSSLDAVRTRPSRRPCREHQQGTLHAGRGPEQRHLKDHYHALFANGGEAHLL